MEEPQESTTGLTPAIFAAGTVGSIVLVGLVGALVAWIRGRGVDASVALAYYFVGGIVFLVGSFPTGGFSLTRGRTRRRPTGGYSMIRGTITRRRPIGARQEPVFLLGLVLVGLGVVVDLTRPF